METLTAESPVEASQALQGSSSSLSYQPVSGVIGAEVTGIDLRELPSPQIVKELSAALVKYKVLFFRDQPITRQQHIAFGRCFGKVEPHPYKQYSRSKNLIDPSIPELLVVESTPNRRYAADHWHTDVSALKVPALAGILRSRVVPPAGGDTIWANMAAAYEGLDDATKSLISGLRAYHTWNPLDSLRKDGVDEAIVAELDRKFPLMDHPIVWTHPVSGEKVLFVNDLFTTHIRGMQPNESRALLERLCNQAKVPEYQVRFHWSVDCVAFWENRMTQHYGVGDFFPHHRLLDRVTVSGETF